MRTSRRKDDGSNEQCSGVKIEENGDWKSRQHEKNRQRWSKIVHRLGRKNLRFSYSANHHHTSKISDGTIDEEKEAQ